MKKLYRLLLAICLLFSFAPSYASHIAGGEIYYQWISGYTYKVSVVIYADCSGSVYYTLGTSALKLNIYNADTLYSTDTLQLQSITPINTTCTTDSSNTTCHGGTLLGLSNALFSDTITLPGPSDKWEFYYYGDLTVATGFWVNDVTNLYAAYEAGLVATLDNTVDTCSSPVFSVPPLFNSNVNQKLSYCSFPTGTAEDSLTTVLTDAMSASGPSLYRSFFDGLHPLTAKVSMDSTYGIFSCVPSVIEKPVIAEQIKQYRHGRLIGTVMREWAMVISSTTINNLAPKIGNTSHSVTALDTTYAQVYKDTGSISYQVVCNNPDSNNITMEAFDLPAHTIFTVTGNGTKHPVGNIVWKTDSVAVDSYSFLIRVTDDGCPYPASYTQVFTTVVKKATGVTDINASNTLAIYPNPAGKYIKLKGIKANKVNLDIIRTDGAIVKTLYNCSADNAIDISFLSPGLYCLVAHSEDGINILKGTFVKE